MIRRITYHDSDGSWGVVGVDDLSMILNPRIYAALVKLRDMEDLLERMAVSFPDDKSWEDDFNRLLGVDSSAFAGKMDLRETEGRSAR